MPTLKSYEHDVITPVDAAGELPEVRRIGLADLWDALAKGVDDFRAMPSHAIFLGLIYPFVGLLLATVIFGYRNFELIYPAAAGFALMGPFVAIGLYELSRRREAGRDTNWTHVFDVRYSPSFPSLLAIGGLLLVLFFAWIATAHAIFTSYFGRGSHDSLSQLLSEILTTSHGHSLMVVGNLAGLAFAVVAMMMSVVSFPLLLDRNVGVGVALATSVKVVVMNPVVMICWGLVVAALLVLGALPMLMGLAVVVPILGHATWHLYRKVVVPQEGGRPEFRPKPKRPHYAAQFPASLFVGSSSGDDEASGDR